MRCAALFHKRLAENFRLRQSLPDFSAAFGKTHIWFHASSAGEYEQVRAVALEMRRHHKNLFLSFSYFSDSAYKAKKNDPVPDLFFALPFDFPWLMARLVRLMKPQALIIGKYDAWPNQVLSAVKAQVPVFLASATLPEKSLRHKWPLRHFMRSIYMPMKMIFSISDEHTARFRKISSANVVTMGDTRFDAIAERLKDFKNKKRQIQEIKRWARGKTVLVAGSTYESSEAMITAYLAQKPAWQKKKIVAIIAPHHIGASRLEAIESMCQLRGLSTLRESRGIGGKSDVLIIDSLGLLPFLYPLADVAYVGGGFEGSVHSVIEAAAEGIPMITGPGIKNSAEAIELEGLGLLAIISRPDGALFSGHVENLCKTRTTQGKKIRAFFRQRLGVSRKIMHTVMDNIFQ
jgi:3-deoxy-D-manno-octulosonic-acid transferase